MYLAKNRRRGFPAFGMTAVAALATATALVATPVLAEPKGTLTIAVVGDPTTMDPQMHRSRHTQTISNTMREKLFYQLPPKDNIYVPLLAESLTQVDDTHYDLKLKEGIKFHNGDELTSADVVYTFERLWDPANKSPRATMGNMPNIESVVAIDKYTIRWTTKIPFGPPDEAVAGFHLAGQEILSKAVYEKLTLEEARTAAPVGVGPFKFVEWIPEQRLVMEAFDDYWQGAPGVKNLIWRTIPEESTRVAELLSGSVDIIYPVTPDFVEQLTKAGMNLVVAPGTSARMLQMNVREGSPFADLEVRKAMNRAIDTAAITEEIYRGLASPFEQIAGNGAQGNIEGYDPYPFDPEAAKAVLSKVTAPIELFTGAQEEIAAEAIAEQLRGYGMKVTAVVLDAAALSQRNDEGNFDVMLYSAGFAGGAFIGSYYTNNFACSRLKSGQVRTGFCEPKLDEMAATIRAEPDVEKRNKDVEGLTKILIEDYAPWVPLFGPNEVWALSPRVKGFQGSSTGQFLDLQKVTVE